MLLLVHKTRPPVARLEFMFTDEMAGKIVAPIVLSRAKVARKDDLFLEVCHTDMSIERIVAGKFLLTHRANILFPIIIHIVQMNVSS